MVRGERRHIQMGLYLTIEIACAPIILYIYGVGGKAVLFEL